MLFVGEGDFFFSVGIGLYGVLRANEFEKLIGAFEIEFLLDAILRPAPIDSRFCGVERAVVDTSHYGNLEMKGGVLLADLYGGETAYLLVGAIEGGDELLLIVMRDVKLQAEAHAVAFQRALPHAFRAGDGIGWLLCAGAGGLAMKNKREADVALRPATVDTAMIGRNPAFIGSADGSHIEL